MNAASESDHVALYHWSPTNRRASIALHGLGPGHSSLDGSWRPPYLCLATTPHHAWHLNLERYRAMSKSWDLWQVYTEDVIDPLPRDDYPSEVRTAHVVKNAYLIGTRDSRRIVPAKREGKR